MVATKMAPHASSQGSAFFDTKPKRRYLRRAPSRNIHVTSRGVAATRLHGISTSPAAASPRLVSTEYPRHQPRRRRDSSPRDIHVAVTASPRLVSTKYPRRSHGVAATRLLKIRAAKVQPPRGVAAEDAQHERVVAARARRGLKPVQPGARASHEGGARRRLAIWYPTRLAEQLRADALATRLGRHGKVVHVDLSLFWLVQLARMTEARALDNSDDAVRRRVEGDCAERAFVFGPLGERARRVGFGFATTIHRD